MRPSLYSSTCPHVALVNPWTVSSQIWRWFSRIWIAHNFNFLQIYPSYLVASTTDFMALVCRCWFPSPSFYFLPIKLFSLRGYQQKHMMYIRLLMRSAIFSFCGFFYINISIMPTKLTWLQGQLFVSVSYLVATDLLKMTEFASVVDALHINLYIWLLTPYYLLVYSNSMLAYRDHFPICSQQPIISSLQ